MRGDISTVRTLRRIVVLIVFASAIVLSGATPASAGYEVCVKVMRVEACVPLP